MKAGDIIRVTSGEHQGKTGGVTARYQAQGLERLKEEDFSSLWYVEFEDGTQGVIHEYQMEVI
jgi:hypothetical protein